MIRTTCPRCRARCFWEGSHHESFRTLFERVEGQTFVRAVNARYLTQKAAYRKHVCAKPTTAGAANCIGGAR